MRALGIDVGTTNLKVVLVDDSGQLRAFSSRPLHTHQLAKAVTQDPEQIWAAVCSAISEITAAEPSLVSSITSIGVCSQYSSLLGVDAQGGATTPLIMYLDHRGDDLSWAVMERHEQAFEVFVERHGIPPIGGGLSLAHLLFLQTEQTELHATTATYLEVMDFINLRLTGRAAATQCTMFAAQLCDNRIVGTTNYDSDLVAMAGVDPSKLPNLIPVDGILGEISTALASRLGLPTGVTVQAGMNDTQAAAFATSVLLNSQALRVTPANVARPCGLMIGTTAVLVDSLDAHRVDLEHEVLAMPAPVPGRHIVMAENGISGRAVEHALSLLSPKSVQSQAGKSVMGSPFDELESALAHSEPGAGGMLFLPWLAGSMSPRAESAQRGGFIGLSLNTTREQMIRALIEGTAHNLRWLLPAVEGLTGTAYDEIVFGGGAARSASWAQVLADVFNRRVTVLQRPELAAAVAVAMVALFRSAGNDPTEIKLRRELTYSPDANHHELYENAQIQFQAAFTNCLSICEALSHE